MFKLVFLVLVIFLGLLFTIPYETTTFSEKGDYELKSDIESEIEIEYFDYPRECERYLPLLENIESDTRDFVGRWNLVNWDLDYVEKSLLPGWEKMRLRVFKNSKVEVVRDYGGYQNRNPSTLELLRSSLSRHQAFLSNNPSVPDEMDILIYTGDYLSSTHQSQTFPIFMASKRVGDSKFLIPDFTFHDWKEAFLEDWGSMQKIMKNARDDHPYNNRSDLAYWSGANISPNRVNLIETSIRHPDMVDAEFVDWESVYKSIKANEPIKHFKLLPSHCEHKYLIHSEGISYSSRLKYLLSCGSVVFTPPLHHREFWYHLIHPDHVITINEDYGNLVERLNEVKGWDLDKRENTRRSAYEALESQLTMEGVHCYWTALIVRYAKLKFNV